MTPSPRLSIITVNLNNRAGLEKTIQSVLQQSFSDYEFLIIDGGSTDGSRDVINQHERHLSYWVSEPDSGIFEAMNKGIGKACGEYCLFLNSGDCLTTPGVLAEMFAEPVSEDILIGACRVLQNGRVIHIAQPSEQLTLASFYKRTIPHQSSFIKRSLFDCYGCYSQSYKIKGEYEFWIRAIILANCSILASDIIVADYNLEGISSSENNRELSAKEAIRVLKEAIPERILADYETWAKERYEMRSLYWAARKPLIFYPVKWLYWLAGKIIKIRNNIKILFAIHNN